MRIIKNEPEKQMSCPTCKCEFAYLQKDVHDQIVYCPNCNERISITLKRPISCLGGLK